MKGVASERIITVHSEFIVHSDFFFRTLESERFSFSKQSTEPIDKFLRSITLDDLGWKWKCIAENASSCLHAHPMHQRPRGGLEPPTCSGMMLRSDYLIVITGRVCQSTVGFNCDELQALLRRRLNLTEIVAQSRSHRAIPLISRRNRCNYVKEKQ